MSNEPKISDITDDKARSLASKLSELEELLMDLRGELRFLGCDEQHPLTIRLVALIEDFKKR
ncbi:MAG: hypothetical protein GY951_08430 [Psychromonas sp.]|nr:hypothetical protein [Alteromonadales bacterium]MCP5078064.1 hypothetical protein [Psychromonas sp.]